jgi:hydroxyethylthiazole kinase-like uncharacterized protein yjeF
VIPVLTASEMRQADRRTIEEIGLPAAVLMENAGAAVARTIDERYPRARRPLILCGRGNNGGDGFVAARHLFARAPVVCLIGSRAEVKGDARLHMGAYERSGGRVLEVVDEQAWNEVRQTPFSTDLVVDALLGTGLRQEPSGLVQKVIADVISRPEVPVVSVDLPSGLPSDSGDVSWETVRATVTVALAAPKYGHVLPPACERVGEMLIAPIGIPAEVLAQSGARLWLLERADAALGWPRREPGSHKGTYGHVLVIAGSIGKTGAAVLAAEGALFSGAGLVTVATAQPAQPLVAAARPELMTEPLPAGAAGSVEREAVAPALALTKGRDAVVLGPGLGQEPSTREFIRDFVRRCPLPLVIDADGLNALAPAPKSGAATDALRRWLPTVVTPHPGELARLVGSTAAEVQRRRLETARAFALETGAVVALKGQRTVVADAEGRAAVNPTGNPGMATGGTGDVLSGIIGALLARGRDAWTSTVCAVYLHGLAGDRAAARRGIESMAAGDLLESIPAALRSLEDVHS